MKILNSVPLNVILVQRLNDPLRSFHFFETLLNLFDRHCVIDFNINSRSTCELRYTNSRKRFIADIIDRRETSWFIVIIELFSVDIADRRNTVKSGQKTFRSTRRYQRHRFNVITVIPSGRRSISGRKDDRPRTRQDGSWNLGHARFPFVQPLCWSPVALDLPRQPSRIRNERTFDSENIAITRQEGMKHKYVNSIPHRR